MSLPEPSVERSLARGTEAYLARRFEEACQHFENATAIDPNSAQAQLALGAARLTCYIQRPAGFSPNFAGSGDRAEREWAAYQEREKAMLLEQNSTNWPIAEKSLKRANQLDPENALIIDYLCSLYFHWKDPLDDANDRVDEAKRWLERLLEVRPHDKWADVCCGMILSMKAGKLLPNYGRYPAAPEPNLGSLRKKAGPLLAEAERHLARAIALYGEETAAPHFMKEVTSKREYLADPNQAAETRRKHHEEMFREHVRNRAKQNQTAGASKESSSSSGITFQLSPEAVAEDRARPFPPNPWRLPAR